MDRVVVAGLRVGYGSVRFAVVAGASRQTGDQMRVMKLGCAGVVLFVVAMTIVGQLVQRRLPPSPAPPTSVPQPPPPPRPSPAYAPFADYPAKPVAAAPTAVLPAPTIAPVATPPAAGSVAAATAHLDAARAALSIARGGTDQAALDRAVMDYDAARHEVEVAGDQAKPPQLSVAGSTASPPDATADPVGGPNAATPRSEHVAGYYTKDGKYVQGYNRHSPRN